MECRQVMSDNGSAYISKAFAKACAVLGLKHIGTRPYTPHTNDKAEGYGLRPTASTFRLLPGMGLRDAVPELPRMRPLAAALPLDR